MTAKKHAILLLVCLPLTLFFLSCGPGTAVQEKVEGVAVNDPSHCSHHARIAGQVLKPALELQGAEKMYLPPNLSGIGVECVEAKNTKVV